MDVPDPPMEDENSSRENSGNDDSDDQVFEVSRAKSPLPAKIHHLFVKVPPKQTAKFERMVRLELITIHDFLEGPKMQIDGNKKVLIQTKDYHSTKAYS